MYTILIIVMKLEYQYLHPPPFLHHIYAVISFFFFFLSFTITSVQGHNSSYFAHLTEEENKDV